MFLSTEDIEYLTGYKRHADQRAWLADRGWLFEVSATGRPIVSAAYSKQRIDGSASQCHKDKKEHTQSSGPWTQLGMLPIEWYENKKQELLIELDCITKLATNYKYKLNINHIDPVVYFLFLNSHLVYVGQTKNLTNRLISHYKTKEFDSIALIEVPKLFLDEVELHYIRKFRPPYNGVGFVER